MKRCFEKGKLFIQRQALLKECRQNKDFDLNSAEVTLTKSLRNLRDKGYIELLDTTYNPLFDHSYSETLGLQNCDERLYKVKYIYLTEQGLKKAKELFLQS